MKTQDRLVLSALSSDVKAMLLLRYNSWDLRQEAQWGTPLWFTIQSFEDEFRAMEMFVEETTFWSYGRFNPNI